MVNRRDVLIGAGSALVSGSILGTGWWLNNSIQNRSETLADRAANESERLNRNIDNLDSSQQGFDSVEEYVPQTRSDMQSVDESLEEITDQVLTETEGLAPDDRNIDVGDTLGENEEYFVNSLNNLGSPKAGGLDVRLDGADYAQITDTGFDFPGKSGNVNLAVRDGSVPSRSELSDIASAFGKLQSEYSSAADTLEKESGYAQDRVDEMQNPEEGNHRNSLENLQSDLQSRSEEYRQFASAMGGYASFFDSVANASGDNLNISWGERVNPSGGGSGSSADSYEDILPDDCSQDAVAADLDERGVSPSDIQDASVEPDGELYVEVEGGQDLNYATDC
jgi:hypothetical protein